MKVKIYRVPFAITNDLNIDFLSKAFISEFNQTESEAIVGLEKEVTIIDDKLYIIEKGLEGSFYDDSWFSLPKTIENKDFVRAYNYLTRESTSYFEIISTDLDKNYSELKDICMSFLSKAKVFVKLTSNKNFGKGIKISKVIMDSKSKYFSTELNDIYGLGVSRHMVRTHKLLRKDNVSQDINDYKEGVVIGSLEYNILLDGLNEKSKETLNQYKNGIKQVIIQKQISDSREIIKKEKENIKKLEQSLLDSM